MVLGLLLQMRCKEAHMFQGFSELWLEIVEKIRILLEVLKIEILIICYVCKFYFDHVNMNNVQERKKKRRHWLLFV